MELLQLRYFISVVESKSISEAARNHRIPQPSMSQTIAKLEKEIGHKLFDRVSNRLVINRNGQILYEQVKRALQALDDGESQLKDINGDLQNNISLVITNEAIRILECMYIFIRKHPNTRFTVMHHLQNEGKDNPFDLCITHHDLNNAILDSVILSQSQLSVAVPKNHKLYEYDGCINAEMLKGEPLILTRPSGGIGKILSKYLRKKNTHLPAQIVCNDPIYIQAFVNKGMGLAIVSNAYRPLLDSDVRLIPFDDTTMIETSRIYWHTDRYLPLIAREFRSALIESFA